MLCPHSRAEERVGFGNRISDTELPRDSSSRVTIALPFHGFHRFYAGGLFTCYIMERKIENANENKPLRKSNNSKGPKDNPNVPRLHDIRDHAGATTSDVSGDRDRRRGRLQSSGEVYLCLPKEHSDSSGESARPRRPRQDGQGRKEEVLPQRRGAGGARADRGQVQDVLGRGDLFRRSIRARQLEGVVIRRGSSRDASRAEQEVRRGGNPDGLGD